jgi:hypothetical protein
MLYNIISRSHAHLKHEAVLCDVHPGKAARVHPLCVKSERVGGHGVAIRGARGGAVGAAHCVVVGAGALVNVLGAVVVAVDVSFGGFPSAGGGGGGGGFHECQC